MYGIDEKREEVVRFLDQIDEDIVTQKPSPEEWSILEISEHLYLMEQFINYQIKQAIKQGDHQQAHLKPIHKTVNRSHKVMAPVSVKPQGKFHTLTEAQTSLEDSREETLQLMKNKDREILQNRIFPHPVFGDMNIEQWIEFIGWHELRHLDQMKEVKKRLS